MAIISTALSGGDAWSIQHVVLFYSRTESYVVFVFVFAMHFSIGLLLNIEVLYVNRVGILKIIEIPKF